MKNTVKRILSCVIFCAIALTLIIRVNDIVTYKKYNRYYMLDQALEQSGQSYDVQVFGACHSYTSFDAKSFEEQHSVTAYDLGNPGEIVPVTYLRMMERFKQDAPKVALVETWGLNAYETYTSQKEIFESYMPVNIDQLPLSTEKLEVIGDYYSLDYLQDNFYIAKYKDRIMSMELREYDFDYSYEAVAPYTSKYTKAEMNMRLASNGFCEMPMHLDSSVGKYYSPYRPIPDYYEKQAKVADDDKLAYEEDIVKYIDKIIALCEKYDVTLIFYRAPYVSTTNELRKANWLADYAKSRGFTYIDLEKEIDFDIETDFLDYNHLNKYGAQKATEYLAEKILPLIEQK